MCARVGEPSFGKIGSDRSIDRFVVNELDRGGGDSILRMKRDDSDLLKGSSLSLSLRSTERSLGLFAIVSENNNYSIVI